eukprot:m.1147681 g.1147681  ORF g.1147681 m.1147681 type:complete len:354 (-) comp24471_c0_seq26:27-1088(-)
MTTKRNRAGSVPCRAIGVIAVVVIFMSVVVVVYETCKVGSVDDWPDVVWNIGYMYGYPRVGPVVSTGAAMRKLSNLHPFIAIYTQNDRPFPTDSEYTTDALSSIYQARFVYAGNLVRSSLTAEQSNRTFFLPIGLDLHSAANIHDVCKRQRGNLWRFILGHIFHMYGSPQLGRGEKRVQPRRVSPKMQYEELCKVYNDTLTLPRIPLMLITWDHSTSKGDRTHIRNGDTRYGRLELHQQAVGTGLATEWIGYPRSTTWKKMARHSFVLSPLGAGYDCHRTWEALLLGAIVIAIRSPISVEYEKHNLPIVFVDNFSFITEAYLRNLENMFRHQRMGPHDVRATRTYWLSQHTRV